MTKTVFLALLEKHNIDGNLVAFNDSINEGYCVRKNHFRLPQLRHYTEKIQN